MKRDDGGRRITKAEERLVEAAMRWLESWRSFDIDCNADSLWRKAAAKYHMAVDKCRAAVRAVVHERGKKK